MPSPLISSLAEYDYDFLAATLARTGENVMNLEMVDGFFAALACAPRLVMPSQYLPVILGGNPPEFEDLDQGERFFSALMTHWNHVNHTLRTGDLYLPLLLEDADGVAPGNDWAKGFVQGTEFNRADWLELLDDEDQGGAMVAILTLAHEHDPDPRMRPYQEPIDNERREQLLAGLAVGTRLIYEYFEPHRTMALANTAPDTFRRQRPKIGRNAPCPCGSGRKYKQCCASSTLH